MILLYAVTSVDQEPPPGLECHRGRDVAVLYEPTETAPGRSSEALLAFWKRLEHIAAQGGPCLPMRFGTVVESETDLRGMVATHGDSWARQLRHLAGQAEMIVHLDPAAEPATVAPGSGARHDAGLSGAEYLRRRAAAHHAHDDRLQSLADHVGSALREHRALRAARGERLALLVAADRAAEVREAVAAWARERGEAEPQVTGPWPPFSFVEQTTEEVG